MGVKNYQHYRLLGGSVRFRRKASGGTTYPWVDFGTMETPSPAIEGERIELEDGRTGQRQLVDASTVKIKETLPLNVNNLSLAILAMLYASNAPEALTRAAAEKEYAMVIHKGYLHQLEENGLPVHMASAIAGFFKGTVFRPVLTTIVKSTKTLTLSTTDPAIAGAGEKIIVTTKGLANKANAKTYTSAGASAGVGPWTVVVNEEPEADETAITGEAITANAGTIYPAADMDVRSLDDGTFVVPAAASVTDLDTLTVVCGIKAISGLRRLKPQDVKGQIEGEAIITWAEDNNDKLLVRYAPSVSIEANGSTFQNTGSFSSVQLTMTVLSDLSADVPAGYLDQIKGDLPALA